ncbi:TPA: gp58-like family protein [Streptococcus pyogenes]|uniref:gp58-like family protein n=2 Tax=Streptococcus pyogenes TaxID=1314 RepID=UPI0007C39292|nr:gp58-like family protein [Streptococcus pyogenes]OAC80815.1 hyaluronidase [Streptococcus pyogenes]OAC83039.1 hyaluronidase [Streptococcus pyogenes]OAC84640.1 hyaluronidase [Streptococcus pyogenes]OAC88211.1 hyaluronidase [Streptococcus pyogenes]SQH08628.1 Phage infection protein [Streptococcus pyogenes]
MSRDPTLTLDESNLVIGKDGRVHYTFTASQDNQTVRLASKCLGTAHFNQLMIERGDQATSYVAPVVVEGTGNPTGLFKDLKEISLELTDIENSKLWSKIKVNNRGMLQEYYDGTIKTEIINSAQGVATRISEDTGKKLALINDTINGIRREYQNADKKLSASYQAGIDGLKATMANDKIGLQAEIKASAQGLSQKYDDELRKLSAKITTTSSGTTEAYESKLDGLRAEFTHSNQGMRVELESKISGLQSTQQATARQISQEIRNREGAVSRVQQDLASYQRRLQDAEDNYSSLQQTVRGLQSTIGDSRTGVESRLNQLSDLISTKVSKGDVETTIAQSYDKIAFAIRDKLPSSKMSGSEIISAINLDRSGVKITGKNITLDGNSYISNAVIKDAHIANMDAGKINTGYLSGNRIAAEAITGDKIKMDYAFFNKLTANEGYFRTLFAKNIFTTSVQAVTTSASKITGGVLSATNGASRWDLNSANIDFNRDATINFNSKNNALVRKDGTHTAFVHFSNATPKGYTGSALYASIGITSSGDGINSASSGRFAGLRSFRYATGYNHTAAVDQTELYGDNVLIADDFSINRGFKFRPDKMEKVLDMNDLYAAVVALGRCWGHLANVGWNTAHSNFTSAVNRELNNYITKI